MSTSLIWRVGSGLLDMLAPACCPGCLGAADVLAFCPACAPLIEPFPRAEPDAEARPPSAAALYVGPLADAITRFKYAGRSDFAGPLGQQLAQAALAHAGGVQCVVPVPLHPRKLRERGYNPSALLARHVTTALGLPLYTRALRRVRATSAQAGLTRTARAGNVRGAFVAHSIAQSVLLIDDVRTTGATLAEAARALTEAGCPRVVTLALAAAVR